VGKRQVVDRRAFQNLRTCPHHISTRPLRRELTLSKERRGLEIVMEQEANMQSVRAFSLRLAAVREYFFSSSLPQTSADQVSTTFHPLAFLGQLTIPDVVFVSSDGVRFHAHDTVLDAVSVNGFAGLLVKPTKISATETVLHQYVHVMDDAVTFNVVLLAAYDLSPQPYAPDTLTLVSAADTGLKQYGLRVDHILMPGAPLAAVLLAHAQRGPDIALDIYTLAARHRAAHFAISVSNYTHSLDLSTISDERAHQLGEFLYHLLRFSWDRRPYAYIEATLVSGDTRC